MNALTKFRVRFHNLHEDESGMEAAQVILILVVTVLGIMPTLVHIKDTLNMRGSEVAAAISAIR